MATTYTVTYPFSADTTAVATEVNQNFTDVLTALNDFDASNCDDTKTLPLGCISNLTSAQMASTFFKDEDDMASNSATAVASQQSIKAYVDGIVGITYQYLPVNGTSTKVYTKYLIGTLDADTATRVAHGCTAAQILSVSVIAYDDNYLQYSVSDVKHGEEAGHTFTVLYDATDILITGIGSYLQGNAYRIKIEYY